jgi:hypothetical protein
MGPAEFSDTYIYAGVKGGEHILIYQNRPSNMIEPATSNLMSVVPGLVDFWSTPESPVRPGNAMVWPVPSISRLTKTNLFSLDRAPRLLTDMWARLDGTEVMRGANFGAVAKGLDVEVVEVGMYTVVVVNSAQPDQVQEILATSVPTEKRPKINTALLSWFAQSYPNWPLVIACFVSSDAQMAVPFGVRYTPLRKDILYLPGADAHDGNPPHIGERVATDHVLMFGADRINAGKAIEPVLRTSGSKLGDASLSFPDMYTGVKSKAALPNGDWVIPVEDVIAGRLDGLKRSTPPRTV